MRAYWAWYWVGTGPGDCGIGVRWGLGAEEDRPVVELLVADTELEQPIRASALLSTTMRGAIHGRRNGEGAD
jgi:hypothetical protein